MNKGNKNIATDELEISKTARYADICVTVGRISISLLI